MNSVLLKQSTAIDIPFFMGSSLGAPVLSILDGGFTKRISKNGAAFAAMTITITELENGWYLMPLSTAHTDTNGALSITMIASGALNTNMQHQVMTRLPDDLATPTNITAGTITTVTTVTGLTASNLDATISSRMATYTQPAGFLAATFPAGTVANTTNITAGTITTTTNLTNLPSIPADWLTAAGTASDFGTEIGTAVWATTTRLLTAGTNIVLAKGTGVTGFNDIAATDIVSAGAITTSAGKVSGVILTDTLTTYTGNTLQTGDSYALANGASGFVAIKGDSAAIKITTDKIVFTVANQVDANIESVNAVTVLGTGVGGDRWRP